MFYRRAIIFLLFCSWSCLSGVLAVSAAVLPQEHVTVTPLLVDGVLYVASTEKVTARGHLRAVNLEAPYPYGLWDAAEKIPPAGKNAEQPVGISVANPTRYLFTNLEAEMVSLEASQGALLAQALGLPTLLETEMLVHAVRGRRGVSSIAVAGDHEDPQRLWGISRSSPVMVGRSLFDPARGERDRILYVGAEDGMLHAFYISRLDDSLEHYLVDDPDGGRELWAYLPGSLLPYLKDQPLEAASSATTLNVDSTPVVRELFLDLDGDGRKRWHTLLVATATMLQSRKSCLFVLDVTDPYRPQLIWERLLPGAGVGRTRGLVIDRCSDDRSECLYLTADFASSAMAPGINALAVKLENGEPVWQFSAPYGTQGVVAASTPAVPNQMDLDGDQRSDTLVFGDLTGQLWALDLSNGQPYSDGPIYSVPGGAGEPIGAGVAVYGRLAIFGTGGVAGTSDQYQYALYAVEVSINGGSLKWKYPLAPGEKVWATPTVDGHGNVISATASGYQSMPETDNLTTSGRIVALEKNGTELTKRNTEAGTVGQVVSAPGVVVSVALTGEATQLGQVTRLTGPDGDLGSVKILSWRQR